MSEPRSVENDAPVALPRYGCPALRSVRMHYAECGVIPPAETGGAS